MAAKTKLLIIDGSDHSGKSTLIKDLSWYYDKVEEIKFKKTLPSGDLLRINSEKDFELLFSMFELLDKKKTYVLDRFIVSNLVYDKVFRNASEEYLALSKRYYAEMKERFNVLEVFLTRDEITTDFEDDRLKMPKDTFNLVIKEYLNYGPAWKIIDRVDGQIVLNDICRNKLLRECNKFIQS